MAWSRFKKKEMPGGLWLKCPSCGEMIYKKDLEEKLKVCPKCDHHHTVNGLDRVRFTLDEGSAVEIAEDMQAVDRLEFEDKGRYSEKLLATMEKTKRKEAMWIGTGRILGREVAFGALDFSFLGGSMGVVVGEKVAIIAEHALAHDLPLILVAASGGARMHEGALSLMQMAKSCAVLAKFDGAGRLYISVLANPTTGGVTASWATQADVVLAEPGALIGFAGPRVIKTTLHQDLPEGFQRSEFLIEKGQIDRIVSRDKLRETIHQIMEFCLPQGASKSQDQPEKKPEAAGVQPSPGPSADSSEEGSKPSEPTQTAKVPGDGRESQPPENKTRDKKSKRDKAKDRRAAESA